MGLSREKILKARKWYDSFLGKLESEGLTYNNPLSLGFVKIVDESNFDRFNEIYSKSFKFDEMVQALEIASSSTHMAFMNENEKRPYESNDKTNENQNYIEHLYSNMKNPKDLTDEEVFKLYEASQNGKLIIESRKGEVDNLADFNHVLIDENGEAKITEGLGEFDIGSRAKNIYDNIDVPYKEEEKEIIKKQGYTEEEFKKVESQFLKTAQMMVAVASDSLDDSVNDEEIRNVSIETIREGYEKLRFPHMEHKILCLAYGNPEIFKTTESRSKVNEVAKAYGTKGISTTEKDRKVLQDSSLFEKEMVDFGKRIRKELKLKPNELIPRNIITDHEGKDIGDLNTFEGFNKFANTCYKYRVPFKINGKPVQYNVAMKGIFSCAPAQEYINELEEVYKELKNTNQNLTKNSKEYEDLLNGLKAVTNKLKERDGDQSKFEFSSMEKTITNVANLARAYKESHKNGPFKSRNLKRLAAMSKLERIENSIKKKDLDPGNKIRKMAEKITLGSAISMFNSKIEKYEKKGKDLLFSHEALTKDINVLGKTPEFEFMMTAGTGKMLSNEKLKKMVSVSNEKAFEMLGDSIDKQEKISRANMKNVKTTEEPVVSNSQNISI